MVVCTAVFVPRSLPEHRYEHVPEPAGAWRCTAVHGAPLFAAWSTREHRPWPVHWEHGPSRSGVWSTMLSGAPCSGARLSGARLSGAPLSGAPRSHPRCSTPAWSSISLEHPCLEHRENHRFPLYRKLFFKKNNCFACFVLPCFKKRNNFASTISPF